MVSSQAGEAEWWRAIDERFAELRWVVENTFLETRSMAVGTKTPVGWRESTPRWRDAAVGVTVKAWAAIPYQAGIEMDAITDRIEAARRLAREVEPYIRERQLSPQFVARWGQFCAWAGAIELLYLSKTSDMHAARSNAARSVDAQRKWVALQLIKLMDAGESRKVAEATVFVRLKEFLKIGVFPPGFDRGWYERIIDFDNEKSPQNLKRTFRGDGMFSREQVDAFRGGGGDDVPPVLV